MNTALERAKDRLARHAPAKGITVYGIPLEEYNKEDLMRIVAMSMKATEQVRAFYRQDQQMRDTFARARQAL